MNILHIDLGREMRGGQYQALILMQALAERGHRQLLLTAKGSPLLGAAREAGIEAAPKGWRMPAEFDLIHVHDAKAHSLAALQSGKTPVVVSRRVAFPVKRGVASRWKYGRAAHYIAVSDFVRGQLARAGVPSRKITVIYDGVRMPKAIRKQSHGKFVAGAIAAPSEKPVRIFLEAAAARPSIEGRVGDAAEIQNFDVLVYLSSSEGLGSGILLAMAHGIPVIASNVGGIPEIVAHEKTGLLVENTVDAVGRALDRLAADRALCRTMGAAGRDWVASNATDEILAARTEAVYRKILGS